MTLILLKNIEVCYVLTMLGLTLTNGIVLRTKIASERSCNLLNPFFP